MSRYTYVEIAADWNLWEDYVDPEGHGGRDAWLAMPMIERLAFIEECFGPEEVSA